MAYERVKPTYFRFSLSVSFHQCSVLAHSSATTWYSLNNWHRLSISHTHTHTHDINGILVRFQLLRGLRRGSATEIVGSNPTGDMSVSLLSVVCCQVELSASGWSLLQRSPTDCHVSECDRESLIMRTWPTKDCCAMVKRLFWNRAKYWQRHTAVKGKPVPLLLFQYWPLNGLHW